MLPKERRVWLMTNPASLSQRSGAICTFQNTRCQMLSSMRPQRISRLQGVSPLVSPYRRQFVAELYGGLFFHGLCSPSRSDYASLLPLSRKTEEAFASQSLRQPGATASTVSESPPVIPSTVALVPKRAASCRLWETPSKSVRRAVSRGFSPSKRC